MTIRSGLSLSCLVRPGPSALCTAFTALPAERQIVLDRSGESLLEIRYGPRLKGDDIAQIDHLAMEDFDLVVVFDSGLITLIAHHSLRILSNTISGDR